MSNWRISESRGWMRSAHWTSTGDGERTQKGRRRVSNAIATRTSGQLTTIDDPILRDAELWDIVSSGDLKALSAKQRSDYYLFRCRQEGLNPASQPFTYLVLNGKGVLYGNKTAADQLRKLHGISVVNVVCTDDDEYITYEVTVRDRDGREDFELGSVFVGGAKGVERANAKMKALTKAKRRATYSICGTGVLDETEVETIAGARMPAEIPDRQVERVIAEVVDQDTGEITAPPVEEQRKGLWADFQSLGWSWEEFNTMRRELKFPPLDKMNVAQVSAMAKRLIEAGGNYERANEDDEPAQDTFIDAESRPAGEPGLDRHSA